MHLPTERPWYFVHHLSTPKRPVVKGTGRPPEGAAHVDGTWCLQVEGSGEELATAANEVNRFFSDLGVQLIPEGGSPDARSLRLVAGSDRKAEGYELQVTPSGITVRADGPRGVLHGVYALEEHMARSGGPWLKVGTIKRSPFLKTRILRSFWSPYYVDELTTQEEYYPDGYLENLARLGFNGIWLHGDLRQLTQTDVFPELGTPSEVRIKKLRTLVRRAARYGIDVYLYFCEPVALPTESPFWEKYPQVKGTVSKGNVMDLAESVTSLCTSTPEVQAYITQAYTRLLETVPGLGGVILITASENHSHCYSHGREINCPRCSNREPDSVVTELISLVEGAVHRVDPLAQVIVWTWSWGLVAPDPQVEMIAKLPKGIAVMSDFERGSTIERLGQTYWVDEYAMSVVGPSPRFRAQMEAARSHGVRRFAKMQLSTTHELVTVPYYPIPWRMAAKWEQLRSEAVDGVMGSWIFGNYPSFVMEVVRELTWEPHPPLEQLLHERAAAIFGPVHAQGVLEAWKHFGEAFEEYPFSMRLVYFGPMNRAPALAWSFQEPTKPAAPSWLPAHPYDSLHGWMDPYTPEVLIDCFSRFLERWERGLQLLDNAVEQMTDSNGQLTPAAREWVVAHAVATHIRSTIHFIRYAVARKELWTLTSGADARRKERLLGEMMQCVSAEIENREAYLPLVKADSRLGFHSEVEDYLYTWSTLKASIEQLKGLADQLADAKQALYDRPGAEPGTA